MVLQRASNEDFLGSNIVEEKIFIQSKLEKRAGAKFTKQLVLIL
jgi:hypothetical protein